MSEETGEVARSCVQVFVEMSIGIVLLSIEGGAAGIIKAMPSFDSLLLRLGPFDPNPSTSVQ